MEAAGGLPVEVPEHSDLKGGLMTLGLGCHVTLIREVDKLTLR
jgi:hypothetical protein